jgi:hypothetical protein
MDSATQEDTAPAPTQEKQAEQALRELHSKANVVERPFVSNKPLVGPVIVAIREMWNSVSTKWFVRAILQQQNDFNVSVARLLEALQGDVRRLIEMESRLSDRIYEGDRDNTVLAKGLVELSLGLEEIRHKLDEREASIDERLTRVERALETANKMTRREN